MTPLRKVAIGVAAATLALCGLGAALSGGDEPDAPANAAPAAATTAAGSSPAAAPAKATTPALTAAQRNAVRSAENYLDMSGFSRSGLIKQLKYEGYSTADATLAVDSLKVDWMLQATRTAARYVAMTGFSRAGLIKQLEYEGYTKAQAAHGADSVGL